VATANATAAELNLLGQFREHGVGQFCWAPRESGSSAHFHHRQQYRSRARYRKRLQRV